MIKAGSISQRRNDVFLFQGVVKEGVGVKFVSSFLHNRNTAFFKKCKKIELIVTMYFA